MIRPAKFTDIPRIAELLVEAHKRSRYAETDIEVDVDYTKRLLMTLIQRHGAKGENASWAMVSERADLVEGFIIGVTTRIQEISNKLMATDLFFYQSPRAPALGARLLLQSLVDWAKASPKIYELTVGCTDVIGDYKRTSRLYGRLGFRQRGAIFGMRTIQ